MPAIRFKLRTLLIATTLLAIILGYVGNVLIHIRRESAVAALIKQAGGSHHFQNSYAGISSDELERDEWNRKHFGEHTFRYIRHVRIYSEKPVDEVLPLLSGLSRLEALVISTNKLTTENLQQIAKCRRLQTLILHKQGPEFGSLSELRNLASLRQISLSGFDEIRLRDVGRLPQLDTVTLRSKLTTPAVLAELKRLPNLRSLEIDGCIDPQHEACAALVGCHQLQVLDLGNMSLNSDDFQKLAKLPQLEFLGLGQIPELDLEAAGDLGRISQLQKLRLGAYCTDETVTAISGLTNLEVLLIRDSQVTDACVADLKRLPKLRHVAINGTSITAAGVKELALQPQIKQIQTDLRLTAQQEQEIYRSVPGRVIWISH